MKSKNEIEQLAFLEFPRLVNDPYNPMEDDNAYERQIWIDAYTKCQEDIKKELYQFGKLVLDTFHSEGKTNSGHERLARQKFDEWFNQHQEDTLNKERREIQPEDIWNKENQDKIKEHILIHASGQSPEDKLETELAAKKYTEEDIKCAVRMFFPLSVDDIKKLDNYINSINKQR